MSHDPATLGEIIQMALADDVIVNDGTLAQLDERVGRLHEQYLALAPALVRLT